MSIIRAQTYHDFFTDFARTLNLKPQLGGYGIDIEWKHKLGNVHPYSSACWYNFMNNPDIQKGCVHINWNPFVCVYNDDLLNRQIDSSEWESLMKPPKVQVGEAGRLWMNKAWIPAVRDDKKWVIDSKYIDLCSQYAHDLIQEWGMEHRISFHNPTRGLPNIQIDMHDLDFKLDLLHVVTGLRLMNEAPASVYAYHSLRDASVPRAWALLWAPHTISSHLDSMWRGEHHYTAFFPMGEIEKTLSTPLRFKDLSAHIRERPNHASFDSIIKKHFISIGLEVPMSYYGMPYPVLWKVDKESLWNFDVPNAIKEDSYTNPEKDKFCRFLDWCNDYQEGEADWDSWETDWEEAA